MDPQQTPINPRLNTTEFVGEPASDWAQSTESAVLGTKSENLSSGVGLSSTPANAAGTQHTGSTSVPGATSHVVQPGESALDTSAKPQSAVDYNLGTASAVSTPGLQVPGAWTDKPSSAQQVLNDAGTALATAGSAAYNALPDSVKGVFSNQTTNTSPVQTTTNHSTTTPVENISSTAAPYISKAQEVGIAAAGAVATGAGVAYEKASQAVSSATTSTPSHPTSLPSEEVEGQKPFEGPTGGAGALPGSVHETGVAVLPDDKEAKANVSTLPTQTHSSINSAQPSITDRALAAAAVGAASATAAATAVSEKAGDVYQNPRDYVPAAAQSYLPGSTTTTSTNPNSNAPTLLADTSAANTLPSPAPAHAVAPHATHTLPSTETSGATPASGPVGGVGSLPGSNNESGVALLPEEKAHPNPLAAAEFAGARVNKEIASPYNPGESPYADVEKNKVEQPAGKGLGGTAGKTGEGEYKEGLVQKAEKALPIPNKHEHQKETSSTSPSSTSVDSNGSPSSPTKKAGFMDKLKGQSKILTGKMSHNEEKVAQGQALKSGTEYSPTSASASGGHP